MPPCCAVLGTMEFVLVFFKEGCTLAWTLKGTRNPDAQVRKAGVLQGVDRRPRPQRRPPPTSASRHQWALACQSCKGPASAPVWLEIHRVWAKRRAEGSAPPCGAPSVLRPLRQVNGVSAATQRDTCYRHAWNSKPPWFSFLPPVAFGFSW